MPPSLRAAHSFENSDLRIVEHKGNRFFMVDQAAQSSLAANGRPLDQYAYFLASRVLLARPEAKNAAIVGLGDGSLVTLLGERGIEIEVAELSPEIIAAAREHFGLTLPPSKVHAADGRVFLRENPGRFDVVVLDAFSGDRLAYTLVSNEGLETAKSALAPGGLLAFFASDQPIEPRREVVTIEAFDGPREFRWLPVPPAEWPPGVVLTDDWNPVDTRGLQAVERSRVTRRADMPADVRAALAWE